MFTTASIRLPYLLAFLLVLMVSSCHGDNTDNKRIWLRRQQQQEGKDEQQSRMLLVSPSNSPNMQPSISPSGAPSTNYPSNQPTGLPTHTPSQVPTKALAAEELSDTISSAEQNGSGQSSFEYMFIVDATYGIYKEVINGPLTAEVEDMIRYTQIFYVREYSAKFGQSFSSVTVSRSGPTFATTHTITVRFFVTATFHLGPGFPTDDEAEDVLKNFDRDDYLSDFVNRAFPFDNFVFADSIEGFVVQAVSTPFPTKAPTTSAPTLTPSAMPSSQPSSQTSRPTAPLSDANEPAAIHQETAVIEPAASPQESIDNEPAPEESNIEPVVASTNSPTLFPTLAPVPTNSIVSVGNVRFEMTLPDTKLKDIKTNDAEALQSAIEAFFNNKLADFSTNFLTVEANVENFMFDAGSQVYTSIYTLLCKFSGYPDAPTEGEIATFINSLGDDAWASLESDVVGLGGTWAGSSALLVQV